MSANYLGYRMAQWLSLRLPRGAALTCAEQLADAWWSISAKDRTAVQANLSMLLGAAAPEGAASVREVFRNFSRYVVEFFSAHRVPQPDVRMEGYEHLTATYDQRQGLIILSGHLGNWELGAVLLHRMGFPVSVVALPHQDARMNRLFNQQRQRCGVQVIEVGRDAARRSLRSLQEGRLLSLLGDREFGGNGLVLPLCRRNVLLPRGPAVLSLRGQVPVVPAFLIREGRWRFRFCFEPAVWPMARGGREDAVRALTQRYGAILERYLKRFPTQWLMFQPAAVSASAASRACWVPA